MSESYHQLDVEQVGDVTCLRLRHARLEVGALEELLGELDRCLDDHRCRKVVFSLGPEEPQCLYSIFLAKLVSLQKRLQGAGGALVLAEASDNVARIFQACRLHSLFTFVPERAAAVAALSQ
jgi:anti-anti-sigma factor